MGLFSSSTKYYAYAGSDNLFEDDDHPNTVLSLMINGILGNTASPAEAIITGLNTNLYARAKSMFKYAGKPDGYVFGYPTTNIIVYNITTALLRPFIEADVGSQIDFRTLHWGQFQNLNRQVFWIEMLINQHYLDPWYFDWKPPLKDPLDTNWSPVDTTVEVPVKVNEKAPTKDRWAWSNNQYNVVVTGNLRQVSFPYEDVTYNNSKKTYDPISGVYNLLHPFDLTPYNNGSTWIQVRYRIQGMGDQYLYWYYEIGSNANPGLEAAIAQAGVYMEYLPIAVLMHDTVWFDEAGWPEWEDTLDRLLKDLTLDPYDIKDQYLTQQAEDDASGDQSKNNAETWDFFIQFAIPLKTQFRGAQEYLFRFYDFMRTKLSWTFYADYQAWLAGGKFGTQPASNMSIEEGVMYTGYIARYAWSYIERLDVAGSFTPPGWTDPLRPRRLWSHTYELGDPDYNEGLDLVHGSGNYLAASSQGSDEEHAYTIITRMNEDDTHTHMLMMGPSMEYQINTSQTPVGTGSGGYVDYQYRFVDVELFPDDPEEDSEFRWPVHMATLREVSAMQREAALADGLCATVFLVEKVKVKWYQKGFFKWLIVIIAIIVIILTWHYELLPTIAAAATAAVGATALGLWALYVVMTFAIGFLIGFAGSLIGGHLGELFVIVGMYMAMGGNFTNLNPFSKLSSAWTNLSTTPSFGSAMQFIQAVYPTLSIGQRVYIEYELHKLEDQMRDFEKTAKEKYEELQDAWDSLGETPNWLNPMDLVRTFSVSTLYEDPTSFYYRTLHANPGTLGYDLIENFTEIATTLPKEGQNIGIVDIMMQQFSEQRGQA